MENRKNIYFDIVKYIKAGNKLSITPNWSVIDNHRYYDKYLVTFSFTWEWEEHDLPTMPFSNEEGKMEEAWFREYLDQFILSSNNFWNLKKEVRDNWNPKYFTLDRDEMSRTVLDVLY